MAKAKEAKTKEKEPKTKTPEVKVDQLYREWDDRIKFPRVVRVRKILDMGGRPYVLFMAENQSAMAVHPNGGFTPLEIFPKLWVPYKDSKPSS